MEDRDERAGGEWSDQERMLVQIIFLRNTIYANASKLIAQIGECCEGDSNFALKILAGRLSQVEKWTGSGERGDPSDSGMVPPGVRNSLGLSAVYDLLRAQFRKVLPLRGASPESDQDREEVDVYG